MSEKQRIHIAYCDYQITKANNQYGFILLKIEIIVLKV